jgi:hypothetical protein
LGFTAGGSPRSGGRLFAGLFMGDLVQQAG